MTLTKIDVIGDVIHCNGFPVGFLTVPTGSMRDKFIDTIDESVKQRLDDFAEMLSTFYDELSSYDEVPIGEFDKFMVNTLNKLDKIVEVVT